MLQVFVNSIISGLLLAVMAMGFHIIFKTTGIFHMAHGGIYVVGAYVFCFLKDSINFFPALALVLVFSFLLGVFVEWGVYKPLQKRSNNQNITLISSLGVYVIMINIIAIIWGNDNKIFNNQQSQGMIFNDIIITQSQLSQLIVSTLIIIAFVLFIRLTGIGLKIRAVSNNYTLARVVGINTQQLRYIVFGVGSIMAVSAAILQAYENGINPYVGMSLTLSTAVVVVVGGMKSIYGTLIASLLLALIQNSIEFLLNASWKEPITFTILLLVLLWRTEGILQFNIRADER